MLAKYLAPVMARRGIHYGWLMVAITFLTQLCTAAAMGNAGVLLVPLKQEFGWDTGAVSGPLSLRLLLYGLVAPFAAAVMLRYGLRVTVFAALILIVGGLLLATQVTQIWHLWVTWGILIGLGTGMTAMVLGATVANRWFTARRGLVLGMLAASVATGQLVFLPIAAWLAEHVGWRAAVLPAAGGAVLCLILILLFARDYPAEVGVPPFGEARIIPVPERNAAGNAVRLSFMALAEGAGSRTFWVLFFTFLVCGLSTSGLVQPHFIPLCHDFGIPEVAAAGFLAIMGVCDFFGTIGSGWLSDRVDNRWLLFWYYFLRGLSLLWLPFSGFTFYGLSLFAVFFGLDFVATVPPTGRLSAAEFGREKGALVFGWLFMAHQLGGAIAAAGTGVSRDLLASYLPAFFLFGVVCVLGSLSLAAIRRPQPALAAAVR
jgi:MFS family permease